MRQVFITGASSDIGVATCKKYLAEGFHVIGHYNNGQDSFFGLVDSSPNMQSMQIDLSDSRSVEQALTDYAGLFQKIDVLINMAATFRATPFSEITATKIEEAKFFRGLANKVHFQNQQEIDIEDYNSKTLPWKLSDTNVKGSDMEEFFKGFRI